ncbi:MAG: SRPBCC family protein [Myxococcales bacterium]|jgi:hypothetical protein
MHPRTLPLIALLAISLSTSLAAARPDASYDAATDRLRGLGKKDLERIDPLLSRGPVALVEFADMEGDQLPAINVASLVNANADQVLSVLRDPARYPRFIRTLDAVEVVARHGASTVYDWRWQLGMMTLDGRNNMRIYPAPASRPSRGHRVTIDSQHGDLGRGRMSLRVLPRGPARSLLVVSMRLDLREANYIARQVAKAARSVNRAANMSLAYSMLLSFRREAERRAGHVHAAGEAPPLGKPPVNHARILPLLVRGDLVVLDMRGDHLDQVAVYGLISRKRSLVREVMLDADAFGSSLMPGSAARIVEKRGPLTTFDWDIDLPLVGVSGRMQMRDEDPVVAIEATDGALQGGRWHFETAAVRKGVTMIAGWARFDLRNSNWLLRSLLGADPYLGHGMTAASEVMLVRALRSRTRKLQKARADAAAAH